MRQLKSLSSQILSLSLWRCASSADRIRVLWRWLYKWDHNENYMRESNETMKPLDLELMLTEEEATQLMDCIHYSKVKERAVDLVVKKVVVVEDEGKEEHISEDDEGQEKWEKEGKRERKGAPTAPQYGSTSEIWSYFLFTFKLGGRKSIGRFNDSPSPDVLSPNTGKSITNNVGESECEMEKLPPPKKDRKPRPTIKMPSCIRLLTGSEDVPCMEAGPLHVKESDEELVRLRAENAYLYKENVGLQELQAGQCTLMLNVCYHIRTQQVELLSMSNKFYT
ncbi:hypothetical protein CY34DRAFT_108622 [Suillus luteus UH-Slu-Lm8-n1]|uniref:Uncharacterized protein n=1 Tax=Suillus luteus UH-Slu-Lm8-n1 TaxID=930992 RepID=A0A0D0A9V4_9AGAM|nr:hypothetical protein CY34DRAFT_108622 [Suillus luteus UH-Slu-Lm8-n1]